ncbi:GNAT family N-acetyltransferase [Burkholderia sp. Tr-20390]|uniref:GNAT family N-acetyltransferase n=1 Tax=Burkholderia sp. Tr-20390 TaxID=2703904 RepID=UPI00197F699E|nr:GNAT family N-acetyltransferase [Burkholderia sp. Tr-20390]MBN3729393.1 N-acetyltransferase [Burkholderia sp. Tr-20390]
MMKAGRYTFEPITKIGSIAFAVEVEDLNDGEFAVLFFADGSTRVGRAKVRVVEGRNVWINHIEVDALFRRRGYASALVQWIVDACGQRLVPVNERGDGPAFWSALRDDPRFAGSVESGISQTTYVETMRQFGLLD